MQSMSKLLECLDSAVDEDSSGMEASVVDKGYMAQLIEVQHMRGATGGQKFHALLKAGAEKQPGILGIRTGGLNNNGISLLFNMWSSYLHLLGLFHLNS